MNLKIAALTAIAALCVFCAAQSTFGVFPTEFTQVSDSRVAAAFSLTNPTSFSQGQLTAIFNSSNIAVHSADWNCLKSSDQTGICTKAVSVTGTQKVNIDLDLTSYFSSDYVSVTYEIPEAGLKSENHLLLSHPYAQVPDSQAALVYVGILLAFLGGGLFVCLIYRRELLEYGGIGAQLSSLLSYAFLVFSVISSAVLSIGAILVFAPQITPFSASLFGLSFALCFLLLHYIDHLKSDKEMAMHGSVESAESQRERINQLLRTAKIKFMKKEIDEATFRKITGDLQLDLVKLETGRAPEQLRRPKLEEMDLARLPPWREG